MSGVDFETAGAKAAGACVKALNSGLGDSRQIVCFEAVIYELLVARSKLTDHCVFSCPPSSIHPEKPVALIWI